MSVDELERARRTIWTATTLYLEVIRMMSPEMRAQLGLAEDEELRALGQAERWAEHTDQLIDDALRGE